MNFATRIGMFLRSLITLGVVAVGGPLVLRYIARLRFDGAFPFHGVPAPTEWESDRVLAGLTEQLTESTIADVVIRAALVVGWVALAVFVLTVVAETIHLIRHDGVPMPRLRGLGVTQSAARAVAVGLLVLLPTFSQGATAFAQTNSQLAPFVPNPVAQTVGAKAMARPLADNVKFNIEADVAAPPTMVADGPATVEPAARPNVVSDDEAGRVTASPAAQTSTNSSYTVRAGDSIYSIAERKAGPDVSAVVDYADQLIELNLGRQMADGQYFTNAAFIDIGWELDLPADAPQSAELPAVAAAQPSAVTPVASTVQPVATPGVEEVDNNDRDADDRDGYTVERGDSLWAIADEEFGDPTRWPEIYQANQGRIFDDGRSLDQADLIQPGWQLEIPAADHPVAATDPTRPEPPAAPLDQQPKAPAAELGTQPEAPAASLDQQPEASTAELDSQSEAPAAPAADNVRLSPIIDNATETVSDDSNLTARRGPAATDDASAPDVAPRPNRLPAPVAPESIPSPVPTGAASQDDAPTILTWQRGAMLTAGLLALLAVRRRRQLRAAPSGARLPLAPPDAAHTEHRLRSTPQPRRADRLQLVLRAAAQPLAEHHSRVAAAVVDVDGAVELHTTQPVSLPSPWVGNDTIWTISHDVDDDRLAELGRGAGMPSPLLVQLGVDDAERDVYVDLEGLGALEIGGPGQVADAIVTAIAASLASSAAAEIATLINFGVDDAALLGHRHHVPVTTGAAAYQAAVTATAALSHYESTTFQLRANDGGDIWEPAVVLVASVAGEFRGFQQPGVAVVSAAPIVGPSSRLAPEAGRWVLRPLDLAFEPIGLDAEGVRMMASLFTHAEIEPVVDSAALAAPLAAAEPATEMDDDALVVGDVWDDDGEPLSGASVVDIDAARKPAAVAVPQWQVVVRLLGPVAVQARSGDVLDFERSKARELIAWIATHPERPTRSAARTAMWEHDVRDNTFSNVVSEARRSLGRLVPLDDGDEWIARTNTDDLPLRDGLITDTELVAHALRAASQLKAEAAIATLQEAAQWVHGMPFAGAGYLWADSEGITSQLVLQIMTLTSELARLHLETNDIDGVFNATARGLRVLPGHEELIGWRMKAYAQLGDHAGVRSEWEGYERVINADPWSDGEPSPKLLELRTELLRAS